MVTAEANVLGGNKKATTQKKTILTTPKTLNSKYTTSTPAPTATRDYVDDTPEVEDDYEGGGRGGRVSGSSDGGGAYAEAYGSEGMDYMSMLYQMMAMQKAAAEEAYMKSKANLDTAYGNTYKTLQDNLNSALGRMEENYKYGEGIQRDDANKSLQQAYINYMMNKRNLAQNLAASGISGGATESSLANMYNNYGNSRNSINTTLAQNLKDLQNTYENNIASANQAYNSQWADANRAYNEYLNGLEQMLAGWQQSNYSGSNLNSLAGFVDTLAGLTGNMGAAAYNFTPTNNTLGVDLYDTLQGNNMGTVTDYAKYLAMLEQMGR